MGQGAGAGGESQGGEGGGEHKPRRRKQRGGAVRQNKNKNQRPSPLQARTLTLHGTHSHTMADPDAVAKVREGKAAGGRTTHRNRRARIPIKGPACRFPSLFAVVGAEALHAWNRCGLGRDGEGAGEKTGGERRIGDLPDQPPPLCPPPRPLSTTTTPRSTPIAPRWAGCTRQEGERRKERRGLDHEKKK